MTARGALVLPQAEPAAPQAGPQAEPAAQPAEPAEPAETADPPNKKSVHHFCGVFFPRLKTCILEHLSVFVFV